jgi:hypothetical protein
MMQIVPGVRVLRRVLYAGSDRFTFFATFLGSLVFFVAAGVLGFAFGAIVMRGVTANE